MGTFVKQHYTGKHHQLINFYRYSLVNLQEMNFLLFIALAVAGVSGAPSEDRADLCFTVKTVTKIWANEITWNIGGTCNSKDLGKYQNEKEDTDQCCFTKGQDKFVITCKDSYGDGWHGGYLEINGKQYCANFDSGKEFKEQLSLGSSEPGSCGVKPNQIGSQIVGGEEAGPYSLPWQVALVPTYSSTPFCGGTLISDRHVLTAAHCTGALGGEWDIIVGEHDATNAADGTRHKKCRVKDHPSYDTNTINNDYAIVTLSTPVTIGTRANFACLPTSEMGGSFLDDKTMTVSGWGRLGGGQSAPVKLYTVDLPGVSAAKCTFRITDQMLCAGRTGANKVGACNGDSGGPLTYNNDGKATLVGVVSWGSRSCDANTIFARVTEVLPWIESEMKEQC